MKKSILLALSLSFLLILSACGIPSSNTQNGEINHQNQESIEPPATTSSVDLQEESRDWMEDAIKRVNEITEENADSYQKCGVDAIWLRKDDMLVFRGTGEIDQITPSDEAKGAVANDVSFIVYESGLTNIGKGFCNRGGGYVILSDTITTISEGCFKDYAFYEFVIPGNVKEIEASAFYKCKFFETLDLPYGLETIGNAAFKGVYFYSDTNKDLIIPESVTKVDYSAFSNNPNLLRIYINNSNLKFEKEDRHMGLKRELL